MHLRNRYNCNLIVCEDVSAKSGENPCWMYCSHACFTRIENPKPDMYYSAALDNCQACGKCVDICPCGFLQIRPSDTSA